jgi:hypothetical protein
MINTSTIRDNRDLVGREAWNQKQTSLQAEEDNGYPDSTDYEIDEVDEDLQFQTNQDQRRGHSPDTEYRCQGVIKLKH